MAGRKRISKEAFSSSEESSEDEIWKEMDTIHERKGLFDDLILSKDWLSCKFGIIFSLLIFPFQFQGPKVRRVPS